MVATMMNPVYLPWPTVMDIADKLQENGYTQLARESRKAVWDEAEKRYNASADNSETH